MGADASVHDLERVRVIATLRFLPDRESAIGWRI
jgi:hypothetical protein